MKMPEEDPVIQPTAAMFETRLHESFLLEPDEGEAIELRLVECELLPSTTARKAPLIRQDPFMLIFEGGGDSSLAQGTYMLRLDERRMRLFLVPVGCGQYQAIFN